MRKFGWFFVFIVIVYFSWLTFSWLTFSCQLKYLRPRAARKRNKEEGSSLSRFNLHNEKSTTI